MKKTTLVLAALLLCSCATYQSRMDKWIGHNVDELITSNGVPTKTADLSNGNKAYEWDYTGNTMYDTSYDRYSGLTTTSSRNFCNTTFITDKSGKIVKYSWRGNCQ